MEKRSASAPPTSDTMVMGAANDTITSTSASGESFSKRSTSQPRVIICMFIAINDMNEPIHIQRKSRICSVSKMGEASSDWTGECEGRGRARVAVDGGGAATEGALPMFCAKAGFLAG